MLKRMLMLVAIVNTGVAFACLWDSDTFAEEEEDALIKTGKRKEVFGY